MEQTIKNKKLSPVFARHETFHPRFGWLKKGYDAAVKSSTIFLEDDAAVTLGVGKNMVRSIRYWCTAFDILSEVSQKGKAGKKCLPTEFGKRLLENNGWDPYLESNAALWLLHWKLIQSDNATAWNFTFNQFSLSEFTEKQLFHTLDDHIKKEYPSNNISPASIKKDVNCIFRMYARHSSKMKVLTEEGLDCPFAELEVIETVGDSPYYTFKVGPKEGLEPEIVVSSCLQYALLQDTSANTIALSRLLYGNGSPGLVFKLSENDIYESIEIIAKQYQDIAVSDSSGIVQFSYSDDPKKLSLMLLDHYFKRIGA